MSDSPYTIPNSAKILRSEFDIREKRMEPSKAMVPESSSEAVTVIAASHKPKKMLRVWASARDQTHRNWQFIFVNTAGRRKERGEVRDIFNASILPRSKEMDILYIEAGNRDSALPHIKYDKIAFLEDGWCWEPGHLESMLEYEKLTCKTAAAAYRVLGRVGGWDNSRVVHPGIYWGSYHLALMIFERSELEKFKFAGSSPVPFAIKVGKSRRYRRGCTNKATVVFDPQVKFPVQPIFLRDMLQQFKKETFGWKGSDLIDYTE